MSNESSGNGMSRRPDIAVVGGAGHAGLPLALTFAARGQHVLINDINKKALQLLAEGDMPFLDRGADVLLKQALRKGLLSLKADYAALRDVPAVIITIGTPVDDFMNPVVWDIANCIDAMLPHLSDGQLLVLRSTVYPGITDWLDGYVRAKGRRLCVAFCPERVVQGFGIEEIQKMPQIISGTTPEAERRAAELFLQVAPEVVVLKPMEAEFAKLFNNAYRYLTFAMTNQFYTISTSAGLDYSRILEAMKRDYPRAKDLQSAGYAAGPCLYKDTLQLSAFSGHNFSMGQSAIMVNEGLPYFVIDHISRSRDLPRSTIGLLGMAFKADSDDPRSSLSYKFKKLLKLRAKEVLTTDPYVQGDPDLLPLDEVVKRSDALIVCTPHSVYQSIDPQEKTVFDIWNCVLPKAQLKILRRPAPAPAPADAVCAQG